MATMFSTLGRTPNALELGFLMGSRMPVTAYGAPSLGLLTAPTIGDTLQFITDIQRLSMPLIDFGYEADGSEGRFIIGFRCPVDSPAEALIVAMCVSAIEHEIARRSGTIGNFARLELTAGSRGAETSYRNWLGRVPITDASVNALVFSRDVLELPNAYADPDTFDSIRRTATKWMEPRDCDGALQVRVRDAVRSNIASPPPLGRIAITLGMTPRQLRQCLQRERTSYQAIVRACRIEYARNLLPDASLSRIADSLGYSDLSAFSHAFYRWTGKSPSAFRNELMMRNPQGRDCV